MMTDFDANSAENIYEPALQRHGISLDCNNLRVRLEEAPQEFDLSDDEAEMILTVGDEIMNGAIYQAADADPEFWTMFASIRSDAIRMLAKQLNIIAP